MTLCCLLYTKSYPKYALNGSTCVQTYEGGLGGEPGNEAHGGYTFCGLAALMLVGEAHQLNLPSLVHWAVHMQASFSRLTCIAIQHCLSGTNQLPFAAIIVLLHHITSPGQ